MKSPKIFSAQPSRRRWIAAVLLACLGLTVIWAESRQSSQVVVSKGGPAFEMLDNQLYGIDQALARRYSLADGRVAEVLAEADFVYLYAFPLTENESRSWRKDGCSLDSCAQATFYNYLSGGTLEIVVDMQSGKVIDRWQERESRPGASPNTLPRALAVAAANRDVQDILGDVRQAELMMVPMSTWLIDNSCKENWCVDLTYPAPDGSGRIFHVIIDLELSIVARTFYTRGRPDRDYEVAVQQGSRYHNGCQEQFDWQVCWEMTAHDGLNFYDASFKGQPIFSSAKIGQVEVFYPSWPGGYRDEIGFGASVQPYYGTQIEDFDSGFEISQVFTEFLRWPNCVCCYRYEQIMRFYADGSFELDFVSHGPGCDDLSSYRPFWRIGFDQGDLEGGEIWRWGDEEWEELDNEVRLSLFDDNSPTGEILYTFGLNGGFRWIPQETDPLNQDDGWLYLLRHDEKEGDGPIAPGPADTFWPVGQWMNDEILEGNNLALWFVPILQTKHGEPWWCMPDPEPDYSPCNAILRVEPVDELIQPTPTPVTTSHPDMTPTRKPQPTASKIPGTTPSPRPVAGNQAQEIILNSGCGSCHAIGSLGESGKVGPDLSNIGIDGANRIPSQSAAEYIRESILEPRAFIAPECPNGQCLETLMPANYRQRLSDQQIQTLVDFLLLQKRAVATPVIKAQIDDLATRDLVPTQEPAIPGTRTRLTAATITFGSVILILLLSLGILLLLISLRPPSKKSEKE